MPQATIPLVVVGRLAGPLPLAPVPYKSLWATLIAEPLSPEAQLPTVPLIMIHPLGVRPLKAVD